ncbi:MAG: aconitate hydratase [Clostridia bacterium BRH_c25]|nr:MAG: aconitate hydratase [Clostridia bacterium BRH_c25]
MIGTARNIIEKIIIGHLVYGDLTKENEIGIKVDQTLTQDPTGIMALLQFEAMGVSRVKTEKSVAYIDHNTLQTGFESADDHRYIHSMAKKHGMYYSRAGNGICHQVHLERFGKPGKILLGSDSHTPTCGGLGMLGIGAGGLDVANVMAGGTYYITMPGIVRINLTGRLAPYVTAKDIALEVLCRLSTKGNVGMMVEYGGEGIINLTVPERATIANMGAELGVTSSIFPSDEQTREFLKSQEREEDFVELKADSDAQYDKVIGIDLGSIVPLAACPHSSDNVKTVEACRGLKVDQICIGSCTNSSYLDLMKVANILMGKTVCQGVSLAIAPGSKQILSMLAQNGALADMINAGARILESACGPCIGMGFSPSSGGAVSLRTFNRNFEGRSGTEDAQIFLVSPETAAASAITGFLTDPRTLGEPLDIRLPDKFIINDNMIEAPEPEGNSVEIVRGPNIKPLPVNAELKNILSGKVLLKAGDNVTTDHIMPAGAKLLPFRANIPYLSDYCFAGLDSEFPSRAKKWNGGFIIAGSNYGQGSSRESAALVPLYLSVKGVIAKSFARIHYDNLINSGILPLSFEDNAHYEIIDVGDELTMDGLKEKIKNRQQLYINNVTKGLLLPVKMSLSDRQTYIILAGGLLNYTKLNSTC